MINDFAGNNSSMLGYPCVPNFCEAYLAPSFASLHQMPKI